MDTGIKYLENNTVGIIFNDNTCPICGEELKLDKRVLSGYEHRINYICSCGFRCPIYHEADKIKPCYDKKIQDFIKSF